MSLSESLAHNPELLVRQRKELIELLGFESRNKYEIALPSGELVAYAAEQQKGFLGGLLRQLAGHWRTFDLFVFEPTREQVLRAHHPFRWLFQRLDVFEGDKALGAIQQRFAFFAKKFDVQDARGRVLLSVSSPIWRPWTFPFTQHGRERAVVEKKWGGLLKEAFTDADNFRLRFVDDSLGLPERKLLLVAALFIDLQYFENKAGGGSSVLELGD